MTTNGALTTLVNFDNKNGANPYAGLTPGLDGNIYGTTYGGGTGGEGIVFQLQLPPDFVIAPGNQTVVINGTVTFNCQVYGTGPFGFQWLSNGVYIAGATNATLSFSPALLAEAASYQVVVTNAYGILTSQAASLSVLMQPKIYAISNSSGGNCTVYLASQPNSTNRLWATSNPSLPSAQWQFIGTNITGSNGLGQFLDTNTAGVPQRFYRFSRP